MTQQSHNAPKSDRDCLRDLLIQDWQTETHPAVMTLAHQISARFLVSPLGILLYGSCHASDTPHEGVVDFYVIVESYDTSYLAAKDRWLNRLMPPNVYYIETADAPVLRAKYAVMSLEDLRLAVDGISLSPTVWARFSQPVRLVLPQSDEAQAQIADCVIKAMETSLWSVRPMLTFGASTEEMWVRLMTESYRTELRVEGADRARHLYDKGRAHFERVTPLLRRILGVAASQAPKIQPPAWPRRRAQTVWFLRRAQGKMLSLLRLSKASLTFEGGLNYLAWKIERHSGLHVHLAPWMHRFPVVAGLVLALKLRLQGIIR